MQASLSKHLRNGRATYFLMLLFTTVTTKSYSQLTYTINSPNGLVITCTNTMVNVGVSITSFPQGPVLCAWLAPSLSFTPGLSVNISTPGIYTLVISASSQTTSVPINITQDQTLPNVSASALTQTLSCGVPSVQLQGSSNTSTAIVNFTWSSPTGTLSGSNYTANANFSAPASTLTANYSLTATNTGNGCSSTTVIPIYQNINPPNAAISPSVAALSCITQSVVLSNFSNGGITPFQLPSPIIGLLWTGPEGAPTKSNSSSYLATLPGTYTMIALNMNNGCKAPATMVVTDNRQFSSVSTQGAFSVSCAGSTVNLTAIVSTSVPTAGYQWQWPAGATVSGANTPTLNANLAGTYTLYVTYPGTPQGCGEKIMIPVYACVGIEDGSSIGNAITMFPNPVKERLAINCSAAISDLRFSIHNIMGQTISAEQSLNQSHELNMEEWAAGIYFVKVSGPSGDKVFRIVKE